MNSISVKSLYGRKVAKVTTLEEAREVIEGSKSAINVVLLPPDGGDSANQDNNVEEIGDKPDDMFEPAGELEIEKDTDSDEEVEETKQLWIRAIKTKISMEKDFYRLEMPTRKKAEDILQSMRKTGGGEGKEKVLTPTEEKLLSLISWVTIKGNEEVEEIGMVAEKEIETVAQPQFNLIPQTESLMEPQPDCLLEPQPDCLSQPHHPEITKRKRSYTCVPSTSAQHEPRKKGVQIKQSESSLQKIVDTYAAAQRQTKEIAELLKLNVSEDFRNRELDLKEREIQVRIIEAQNKSKELVLRERELNIKERELSFKEIEYLEKNKI
ncbi:hypothetical protein RN001_007900 [Aquatica leii]|uniref:Uncharacterized protein n=1 Tax=Aquatica leii TaxID=1421715 RepID=A0AAN7PWZ7_9COLE|nr:hypothetical protein RN001_007900 [Aquatica leii]